MNKHIRNIKNIYCPYLLTAVQIKHTSHINNQQKLVQ